MLAWLYGTWSVWFLSGGQLFWESSQTLCRSSWSKCRKLLFLACYMKLLNLDYWWLLLND